MKYLFFIHCIIYLKEFLSIDIFTNIFLEMDFNIVSHNSYVKSSKPTENLISLNIYYQLSL
jgi:hypothetical protein